MSFGNPHPRHGKSGVKNYIYLRTAGTNPYMRNNPVLINIQLLRYIFLISQQAFS